MAIILSKFTLRFSRVWPLSKISRPDIPDDLVDLMTISGGEPQRARRHVVQIQIVCQPAPAELRGHITRGWHVAVFRAAYRAGGRHE